MNTSEEWGAEKAGKPISGGWGFSVVSLHGAVSERFRIAHRPIGRAV